MRKTFAVVASVSLDLALPGFFQAIEQYGFAAGVDRGGMRVRIEICRLEVLDYGPNAHNAQVTQVFRRAATRIVGEFLRARFPAVADLADEEHPCFDLRLVPVENWPADPGHDLAADNPSILCPKCSGPMVRRSSGQRAFWGCCGYPKCKGSRAIKE